MEGTGCQVTIANVYKGCNAVCHPFDRVFSTSFLFTEGVNRLPGIRGSLEIGRAVFWGDSLGGKLDRAGRAG